MSLVTMLLGGHIDRERDDWMDLSLGYAKNPSLKYLFETAQCL